MLELSLFSKHPNPRKMPGVVPTSEGNGYHSKGCEEGGGSVSGAMGEASRGAVGVTWWHGLSCPEVGV